MDREDIIRMAREAGMPYFYGTWEIANLDGLERFAALVAAHEREKVVQWMMERGYATGHGDTIQELIKEVEWQAKEKEREACRLIVLDNSDAEGICYTNDVIEVFRQRGAGSRKCISRMVSPRSSEISNLRPPMSPPMTGEVPGKYRGS